MTLPPIDPALHIASVHLAVSDLPRSIDFYERILGLPLISRDDEYALLGPDGERFLLRLARIDQPTSAPRGSTGLFHFAVLYPTRRSLAESVLRIAHHRWPLDGASDHGVSEAIYLSDPDGLGIELYADRPREQWSRPSGGKGVNMVTLPLDLDDLIAQAPDGPTPAAPVETVVGHIHLKVADVARSLAFYRDALGFDEQARLPPGAADPSAAFLSAGGYHHHVGLNSWHSQGGASPPGSAPGVRLVEFALSGPEALGALECRGTQAPGISTAEERGAGGGLMLSDPDGIPLAFG